MGLLRGLAWSALVVLLMARSAATDVLVIELQGAVHAVSATHVVAGLAEADRRGARLAVIRIDTPGGLDSAMRQVVDRILASRTPVAVLVAPSGARAASAGFVILLSADVAAMAPGTNTGAAHPVTLGPAPDETVSRKAASDAAAYVRSKAAQRGRNVTLAETAVLESRSFTDREALEAGLVDLVAADAAALVERLEGREIRRFDGTKTVLHLRGEPLVAYRMSWRQAVLSVIAQPDVIFLLLLGALAGLGAEISHPGGLFPGILGALCLLLFLFASQIIPINWAGVLLVLLAVGLFVAEAKVASHGLLTSFGLVSLALGASMLVDAPDPGLRVPLRLVLPAAVAIAVGTVLLVRLVVAAQRRRTVTGEATIVGRRAVALTELGPEGWVLVSGERWRAVADGPVAIGGKVIVTAVDGLTLHVRKED